MIRYRCPKCGANCRTSYCYDCETGIPISQRFDDEFETEPSEEYKPVQNTSSGVRSQYKCPNCGAICQSAYCLICDKSLPDSAQYNASASSGNFNMLHYKSSGLSFGTGFDKTIGSCFFVDTRGKRFKFKGDSSCYRFSDLVNYELFENNSTIQKGGIGRAIIGSALFGDVGAIVGAQTRKSQNVVDSLYIRLTLKSVGMKTITFINSQTDRNGFFTKWSGKTLMRCCRSLS